VLLVLAPVIAAFTYTFIRRTGNIEYALGPLARRRRRRGRAIALGVAALIAVLQLAAGAAAGTVFVTAVVLLIVAVSVAGALTRGFGVQCIDDRHVQLALTLAAAEAFALLEHAEAAPQR
jgi:hypothetical protein